MKIKRTLLPLLLISLMLLCGCSANKFVVKQASKMLSSGESTVFLGDEDPELIKDALPFSMKIYETLLESNPDDPALLLATAKVFIFYSFAFLQTPAEQMPDTRINEKLETLQRAKKMYLRSRSYLFRAMEARHTGFTNSIKENKMDELLTKCKKDDAPYLYWIGMSWMAAFTTDSFDMSLSVSSPKAVKLISKVLELDETLENGGAHEFFISYYGSLPAAMGGSEKKAREHFKKALEISKGANASTYLALATSVAVNNQDKREFLSLLEQALNVDIEKSPSTKTLNIISQRKAKWLVEHVDDIIYPNKGDY